MDITITKVSGTGKVYLRFAEQSFDEDGLEQANKVGFKEIQAGKDPKVVLERAKTKSWKFGAQNRQTGLYSIDQVGAIVTAEVPAGELEHEA